MEFPEQQNRELKSIEEERCREWEAAEILNIEEERRKKQKVADALYSTLAEPFILVSAKTLTTEANLCGCVCILGWLAIATWFLQQTCKMTRKP